MHICLQTLLRQRIYVMAAAPPAIDADYSTRYFTTVLLHDPIFVDLTITQDLLNELKLGLSLTNILDDYDANPFDPGPGRVVFLELLSVVD